MKKIGILILTALMIVMPLEGFADNVDLNYVIEQTANILQTQITEPQVGSIGGEWAIIGLARSDIEIPDSYFEKYLNNAQKYINSKDGILHSRKYTEYSRVILALTALGKDPQNFGGYNLLLPLADYEKTIWQGINGAIWALIALDSGNYEIPQNSSVNVQATRDMYVNHILSLEKPNGGWSMSMAEETPDPDVTAMALVALSKYNDNLDVAKSIDRGVNILSSIQNEKGGFTSYNQENSESTAQVLTALSALKISVNDSRFVKNGYTVIDGLMQYYEKGAGFVRNSEFNLMTTEQAFLGLIATQRTEKNKSFIFDMTDSRKIEDSIYGLDGKNPDVKKREKIYDNKTFEDIINHKNKDAIENLAQRGIINGMDESSFCPDNTMTRAEFATIVTRGLGLIEGQRTIFEDISPSDWHYGYICSAYDYGIIKGVSPNLFEPDGTITKEEAAVMIARAASLCGMNIKRDEVTARNILAEFIDYITVSEWAVEAVAFCYDENILDRTEIEIMPKSYIKRGEVAQIFYNMLRGAKLI